MRAPFAEVAAKRLAERREKVHGPLTAAQKALWEALCVGNMDEAMRQADIVEKIRGPQPRLAAEKAIRERVA